MKLYEVKEGSRVRLTENCKTPPAGNVAISDEIYTFRNLDGMYSYCTDKFNNVVHLVAWAEVEVV